MTKDLFDGIKQWEFETKGMKGKLPVFYYDNTSVTAIYTASTAQVKALLPHPDMRPIELYRHTCLTVFTAFEYRKSDIGPYNEFSIAFPITFRKRQIPGITVIRQMARRCFTAYVWQLPVTTEIARAGGMEMYGLPKFIADISFKKEQGWIECGQFSDGRRRHVVSVNGPVAVNLFDKGLQPGFLGITPVVLLK